MLRIFKTGLTKRQKLYIIWSEIVNDKLIWRLLFADTHAANVSERMCEAIKIEIIGNVKINLTFPIKHSDEEEYAASDLYREKAVGASFQVGGQKVASEWRR